MSVKVTWAERLQMFLDGPHAEGCWEWDGGHSWKGYKKVWLRGRPAYAHRVAYRWLRGPIPDGLDILHSCDNPSCVNPDHLRAGTHLENMQDKKARGRQPTGAALNRPQNGSQNHMAKITEEDVVDIYTNGLSGAECCRVYGVSPATVSMIRSRTVWAHTTAGLSRVVSDGRVTRFKKISLR